MNFKQLATFKVVVEQGNFSKAAVVLDLTKVAVSKQIKAFEKELNVTLFERHSKRNQLTDVGRTIYEKSLKVLDRVHDIELYTEQLNEEPEGELRISCHTGVSETLLLPHLTEFIESYPKISLDLSIGHHFRPEYTDEFDILFGIPHYVAETHFENWHYKEICQGHLQLCASKRYLKKYGAPKVVKDLKNHRYLSLKQRHEDPILEQCKIEEATPNTILSFDDTAALIYAAVQGMGLVIVPDTLLNRRITKENLDLIPITDVFQELKNNSYSIYLLYQKTEYSQPKVTTFISYIMKKLII